MIATPVAAGSEGPRITEIWRLDLGQTCRDGANQCHAAGFEVEKLLSKDGDSNQRERGGWRLA